MPKDEPEMKLVNPTPPNNPIDEEAHERIVTLAQRQKRANGLLMKGINFLGGQVEDTLSMLPKGARQQIDDAARGALQKSYDWAGQSRTGLLGKVVTTDKGHKVLASISGAIGGIGGLPTALAELPIATTMIFRAVQGVAEEYGEDPNASETRMHCLAVFSAGGEGPDDDGVDTAFVGARLGLTGAAVNTLISRIAPKFATVLSQKLASQAVPVLGAAAGAGTNYAFTDYYVEMAHVHFGLRKLMKEHDQEAVLNEFHQALVVGSIPVKRA